MSKTLYGIAGKYQIYNKTCFILQKFNDEKKLADKFKIYNNVDRIPDSSDRELIKKIIDYEFSDQVYGVLPISKLIQ